MAREMKHISFEEFITDPTGVFERVVREETAVLVEKDGRAAVVVTPARPAGRHRTAADYEAFLSAAGSWRDVDTDKLLADIYESRRLSSRPPVEL